ncbi:MAG TPA: HdeD family acid-resistance protein [Bauldia sp.]|nr:HdeD family acid-resistance protein [Bauldia sp.]
MTMQSATSESGLKPHSGWFLFLGIVFIIGGILAIATPLIPSLLVSSLIGVWLAIAGVMQLIQAWQMRESWGGFLWQVLIGVVLLLAGLDIWLNPLEGAITLTLFVAIMFVAKGVFQLLLAAQARPHTGVGWIILSAVVSILVGVLIFLQWPLSAVYLLGTLAGISLLFTGWGYVMLATALRR